MDLETLNTLVRDTQPNICQICVLRDGAEIYAHEWNGYARTDCAHVMSVTKSVMALLVGIAIDQGRIASPDDKVLQITRFSPVGLYPFPTYIQIMLRIWIIHN